MATRVGVDVGGTFTDLIFFDDATGETLVAKEPTTPEAPEQGVIGAFETGVPSEQRRTAQFFLHGTTVGLNALLERKGAVVGLLATAGFRDILEVKRGDRDDPYDLFCKSECSRQARSEHPATRTTYGARSRRSSRRESPQSPWRS